MKNFYSAIEDLVDVRAREEKLLKALRDILDDIELHSNNEALRRSSSYQNAKRTLSELSGSDAV